jgi:hypothetical protein
MSPTYEELLHRFYAGDNEALHRLSDRCDRYLLGVASLILQARTGSTVQASMEWNLDERLVNVWTNVLMTSQVNIGRWPHERLSALTWLIHWFASSWTGIWGFGRHFKAPTSRGRH